MPTTYQTIQGSGNQVMNKTAPNKQVNKEEKQQKKGAQQRDSKLVHMLESDPAVGKGQL